MIIYATTENERKQTKCPEPSSVGDRMSLILIVDDDQDSRLMLKFLLETWNYSVAEAADGFEAFHLAEKLRPSLIFMDAKLPKLSGFEATRLIRESAHISRVPIVFLTGCAESVYRRRAALVGADDYLIKPVDFSLLERALEKYVCRQQTDVRDFP